MNDLPFAPSQLRTSSGFTAGACQCGARRQAVFPLAVGLCAATTQFSIFNGFLWLALLAFLAGFVPARRAAKVNSIVARRTE